MRTTPEAITAGSRPVGHDDSSPVQYLVYGGLNWGEPTATTHLPAGQALQIEDEQHHPVLRVEVLADGTLVVGHWPDGQRWTVLAAHRPGDAPGAGDLDTSSSAARQHFIDTGEYLPVGDEES